MVTIEHLLSRMPKAKVRQLGHARWMAPPKSSSDPDRSFDPPIKGIKPKSQASLLPIRQVGLVPFPLFHLLLHQSNQGECDEFKD